MTSFKWPILIAYGIFVVYLFVQTTSRQPNKQNPNERMDYFVYALGNGTLVMTVTLLLGHLYTCIGTDWAANKLLEMKAGCRSKCSGTADWLITIYYVGVVSLMLAIACFFTLRLGEFYNIEAARHNELPEAPPPIDWWLLILDVVVVVCVFWFINRLGKMSATLPAWNSDLSLEDLAQVPQPILNDVPLNPVPAPVPVAGSPVFHRRGNFYP